MGIPVPRISEDARRALLAHDFPGNARELRNMMERALIGKAGADITSRDLRFLQVGPPAPAPEGAPPGRAEQQPAEEMPLDLARAEKILISRALSRAGGNVSEAARLLGINRTKLYRKLPGVQELVGAPT
jgi:DNA-binding NtrC family response regulator